VSASGDGRRIAAGVPNAPSAKVYELNDDSSSCDPECTGEFVCATNEDLVAAQGNPWPNVAGCYLPLGAACLPEDHSCLSGNCNPSTLTCSCNLFTNFPCDTCSGEFCILKEDNIYSCEKTSFGTGCALGALPPGTCNEPFDQVNCGGCIYGNQCQATALSPTFTPEKCSDTPSMSPPTPSKPLPPVPCPST